MSKHTPGPWEVHPERFLAGRYIEPTVWGPTNEHTGLAQQIAVVRVGLPNTEDNARLIAAAPELLEACKRALPYLADHIGLTLDEGPGDRCAYDLMEAAIQKAEGS